MSLEHSPARQKRAAPAQDETVEEHVAETLADDLLLGAEAIAFFLYGKTGPKEVRDVYRNVFQISLFKHGNTLAAFKSVIRADLAQAQQRGARGTRRACRGGA